MTYLVCNSATVALLSSAAHPKWNVQDEPFGELHKVCSGRIYDAGEYSEMAHEERKKREKVNNL